MRTGLAPLLVAVGLAVPLAPLSGTLAAPSAARPQSSEQAPLSGQAGRPLVPAHSGTGWSSRSFRSILQQ